MSSLLTSGRLFRLLWCVLRGSENDADGGDRNGGGKGLGGRLAYKEMPVSNRKGGISLRKGGLSGWVEVEADANSGRHLRVL
jgi:hypothetical protein